MRATYIWVIVLILLSSCETLGPQRSALAPIHEIEEPPVDDVLVALKTIEKQSPQFAATVDEVRSMYLAGLPGSQVSGFDETPEQIRARSRESFVGETEKLAQRAKEIPKYESGAFICLSDFKKCAIYNAQWICAPYLVICLAERVSPLAGSR